MRFSTLPLTGHTVLLKFLRQLPFDLVASHRFAVWQAARAKIVDELYWSLEDAWLCMAQYDKKGERPLEDGAVHAQAWEAGIPPGHPSR
jgi:hypothetical protein